MTILRRFRGKAMGLAILAPLLLAAALVLPALPAQAQKLPRLVLAGPPAAVSYPLVHMVASGALDDLAEKVEFRMWRDPDQLRALALEGQADVLAVPTNVAANLYNRGAKLQLVNVSTWGILWILSRDPQVNDFADLRGKEIALPFRGDMPDLLFGLIGQAQDLNPRKDMKLRYVASPMDAMQLLLARQVDTALLAEPLVSMALLRERAMGVDGASAGLRRAIDLQAAWGQAFKRAPRIPQAGIAIMGDLRDQARIVTEIQDVYADSLAWCRANADECGREVAQYIGMLSAPAIAQSVASSALDAVPAAEARGELEFLFDALMRGNPASIGGHLPEAAFYGSNAR